MQFKITYNEFLNYLAEVEEIRMEHYLTWVYYLILQDRIEEAIVIYKRIEKNKLEEDSGKI